MTAEVEEAMGRLTRAATFADPILAYERGPGRDPYLALKTDILEVTDALASALRSSGSGEGWVLVPREPTPEMIRSGWPHGLGSDDFLAFWPDLLAASPKALKTGGE